MEKNKYLIIVTTAYRTEDDTIYDRNIYEVHEDADPQIVYESYIEMLDTKDNLENIQLVKVIKDYNDENNSAFTWTPERNNKSKGIRF